MARRLSFILIALLGAGPIFSANFNLQVTESGYLDTQGFSVILYHSTFNRMFFDQKNTAMEMILHGRRIATNGDVRLLPTPEQWDAIPQLKSRNADKQNRRLTADAGYPEYDFFYRLEVTAQPDGVRVAVILEKPLPERLAGRAGFNLEFLPAIYAGKTYMTDGGAAGLFPVSPRDPAVSVPPPPGEPAKLPYQEEWDREKGYRQPLPFATGKSITLGVDAPQFRVKVVSDTEPMSLYDGRVMAQNGWFVLRALIPPGKTGEVVVWHIRPDVIPDWVRPPMVTYNQVGYHPDTSKVAVIELDPRYRAPGTARVLRLEENGQYKPVFEGPVSAPQPWLRYAYAKFDFSGVKEPGLYAIEYGGERTGLFRIARDVYSDTWQLSLSTYLATAMDHVSVREGYRLWHGVSHLDDARQAPPNRRHFDGWSMGPELDSPYKPGEHIPGLNVGGWYDAGDFDIQTRSQFMVIQDLALARREFKLDYDQLTVDWDARSVEMRRPDGVPDVLQQIKHGALQVLAQIQAVGHAFPVINEPTLRQYTHLGDGASKTDNRIYSEKLGPNEVKGDYSGRPDDRWAFTTKSAAMQYGSVATLAAAAAALKGYDDALAKECLDMAVRIWNEEHANPTPARGAPPGAGPGAVAGEEWNAAIQLLIATNGGEPYKVRVREMWPSMAQRFGFGGWAAVHALPYMDADFRRQVETAVRTYVVQLDKELAAMPFGVPPTRGGWGGSAGVMDLGIRMYFLHKAFPDIVGKDYTLRAANFILGTHPVSSRSYVSGVGTRSHLIAYGNNRADHSYIPGGVIPGYVIIQPDFPECMEDFGFLWFTHEYVITAASHWILAANAADALVR